MCLHAIMTNGRPRWAGFCRREEPVTIANTSLPLDMELKPGNTRTWEFQTCEGSLPVPQIQNNNNMLPRICQTYVWGVKKGKAVNSKQKVFWNVNKMIPFHESFKNNKQLVKLHWEAREYRTFGVKFLNCATHITWLNQGVKVSMLAC